VRQIFKKCYLSYLLIILSSSDAPGLISRPLANHVKFKNEKFIFLILYVDGILLASSDVHLLLETKDFLSSHFDMKDLGETSYICTRN
jgi:hypothetical protein